ncbi:MAG: DUF721 domain-containing protein [Planctomycetes bacterium]|nr:DUF721 domain-containing protein [Planctomycetota bacterium]
MTPTRPTSASWVPLRESLAKQIHELGLAEKFRAIEVFAAYRSLTAGDIASQSTPVRFKNGELELVVASATLLHELRHFHQDRLLKGVRALVPNREIRALKFRIATTEPSA